MTVIDVARLEEAKKFIEGDEGLSRDSVSIENGLQVTPKAIEWLKENHYQLHVSKTSGPTKIAVAIYPS